MKMRNFSISALVVASLCVASVAMADLTRVNIVMDISDPYNITLTNYEENGTYGGSYFAIDACEVYGPMTVFDIYNPTSGQITPPFVFMPRIEGATYYGAFTDTVWMVYGASYRVIPIGLGLGIEATITANSSDPDEFYAMYDGNIYPRSFIVVDADNNNGLGGPRFLGTIIPEPASMSLLAVGTLAIIRRRRL